MFPAAKPFTVVRVTSVVGPLSTTETTSDAGTVLGWLDLVTGTDQPTGALDVAFAEESTHVLVTAGMPTVTISDVDRLRGPDGRTYHVTYVDDPVGVGDHLEVYLRYAR